LKTFDVISADYPTKGNLMIRPSLLFSVALLATTAFAQERLLSPPNAEVYIVSPKDGEKVANPITVRFGLKGMGVAPAGIKMDDTGHHHLLIDTDLPADLTKPIPPAVENKILHFGKGQTEVTLTLPPGKHALQLALGDYLHIPHNPAVVSKKIAIEVTK
jgi:hypothetical protein